MANFFIRIVSLAALMLCTGGLAQAQTPPVRVQVYGTHEGPNIVYHYKVINNSSIAVHGFVIGSYFDATQNSEYPQLERFPAGWEFGVEGETGTEILLAPTSTRQPPYWTAAMCGQQESSNYCLEWSITNDGQAYVIPPGQSLAGFSVAVPMVDMRLSPHEYYNAGVSILGWKENDMYLSGSFKLSDWDASKKGIRDTWGQLEIADKTPPTLSVTLTPATIWPPNDKMVTVTATITTKDDLDPNPAVKLVSITANEPLDKDDIQGAQPNTDVRQFQLRAKRAGNNLTGRIYTVTYYVTDGSGNQTEVSTTVTVPHDQGKK